ncbi:TIGR03016 family PEP-CTERM system-associated outer membrane protein [uncultured Dechloromonas sp.]|uniref:TIGR03016 family PEP-CTERM system-associated outer membrane protein n=1 Tax=uncultured Dechloromonas sp. TaxID=171719 RepID=UPI0025D6F948|nr:TIGR03016 family PEP-CTERM system-associated outer membrane protein [uncultured Dechloromonas sp.]
MATDMAMDMGRNMKLDRTSTSQYCRWLLVTTSICSAQLHAQSPSPEASLPSSAMQPGFLSQGNLGGGDGRAFSIKPRLSLSETWSDNVSLARINGTKDSGFITEVAPGVQIDARTARLKGYFDYTLRGQFYTTPSGYSRTQNQLNTFGTLEAVSNWLYLDFSGIIAQQSISAFGTQSPSSANLNSNATETSSYRLSPYIRGQLAGLAEYIVRYNYSTTQTSVSNTSDIDISEWTGQLRGSTPFQSLRWSLDASQQTADYSRGRQTDSERLSASATYTVIPQLRLTLSGGQEANNFASAEKENHTTHGYGFDWNPTERTQISGFKERRFFGDGHRYTFSHRFPLSTISFSDSKDVSVLPNQFATVGRGTVFDQWKQLFSQLLASQYPNPVQLDIEATKLANAFLSAFGIPGNTQATSSFLTSRATIQRRQQLTLAMQGARNTLTVMFNRNENQTILANDTVSDDFSINNTNSIKQRGVIVNFSHQLTGESNATLMASRQESIGAGTTIQKVTTTMYQGSLMSKLGPRTSGSISVRHTKFDTPTNPYTENALIGTISFIY